VIKNFLPVLIAILFCSLSLSASDLEETLEALSEDAAHAYVNPMVSTFGSDMNSGWFHKVPEAVTGKWNLEFGFVGMSSLFINTDDFFEVTGMFNFTRAQADQLAAEYSDQPFYEALVNQIINQEFEVGISGPTITGPGYDEYTGDNGIMVSFDEQDVTFNYANTVLTRTLPAQQVIIPFGGLLEDIPAMPLAAPQLSIGTIYGTSAVFRYLPDMQITPEIGKMTYMGYGIQHNPLIWFTQDFPVDVALAFYTQQLDIGSIVETSATTYGINLARTYGAKLLYVTPYLGFSQESSTMKFRYDYETGSTNPEIPEIIKIDFDVKGKNTGRITTGLSFRLAILNFNFDYSFARSPAASAGVMLNFSW
jgi:hypothetical protein